VSTVGLVLGGGGITGAAFHLGTLLAIQMATGWDPTTADVVVGTSGGAAVAAVARSETLTLDSLVGNSSARDDFTASLRKQLYRRARPRGVVRWMRHGIIPGVRKPGLSLILGSPAPYSALGIADWVEERIGRELADGWPTKPTLIVAYDLADRRRVAFGTEESPDVSLKTAVAASSAVPLLYEPMRIRDRDYVDGGVASGTSVDLLLGSPEPLDFVMVVAPMASEGSRDGAAFYEDMLDRAGNEALHAELELLSRTWPDTEVLVIKPTGEVLDTLRPNPLSVTASVPAFLMTLRSMRTELGRASVWPLLRRHLLAGGHSVAGG
jgi:NTE family protein